MIEQTFVDLQKSAYKIAQHPQLAEDIFMDTYLEVLERFPNLKNRHPIPFKVYYRKVMRSRYQKYSQEASRLTTLSRQLEETLPASSHIAGKTEKKVVKIPQETVPKIHLSLTDRNNIYQRKRKEELKESSENKIIYDRPDIENECTLEEIANVVGKSRFWVINKLRESSISPRFCREKMGRTALYFPKESIDLLNNIKASEVKADNWQTIPELSRETGMDREWVVAQLTKLNAQGEKRFFDKSGRVDLCYPPTYLEQLKELAQNYIDAEPGWYTRSALTELLEKSNNWVDKRIEILKPEGKYMRDDRGVLRLHYSPHFFETLKQLKQVQIDKKTAKKWYEK